MKLYFLRHGIAEDRREGHRDYDRKLTAEGIAEMHVVAQGIARLSVQVDRILSSPLPRALETAKIAEAAVRANDAPIVVSEKLASGAFGLAELQDLLRKAPVDHRVLMVGHEPDLSEVIRDLTGGYVEMKKAGLALVEVNRPERNSGVLRWLLSPRHLQMLTDAAL